jgi:hypothetical protein
MLVPVFEQSPDRALLRFSRFARSRDSCEIVTPECSSLQDREACLNDEDEKNSSGFSACSDVYHYHK